MKLERFLYTKMITRYGNGIFLIASGVICSLLYFLLNGSLGNHTWHTNVVTKFAVEGNQPTSTLVFENAVPSESELQNKMLDVHEQAGKDGLVHPMTPPTLELKTPELRVDDFTPWIHIKPWMRPSQNFAYCAIPKCMTTIIRAQLCCMKDKRQCNIVKANTWSALNGCVQSIAHSRLTEPSSLKKVVVVREPVGRLISAWMDICFLRNGGRPQQKSDCYYCKKNITCFIQKNYEHFKNIREFAAEKFFHTEHHFYPQSWFCQISSNNINTFTVLKYARNNEFREQLLSTFDKFIFTQTAKQNLRKLLDHETWHSTHANPTINEIRKEIFANPMTIYYLNETYSRDYKLFGFTFPSEHD